MEMFDILEVRPVVQVSFLGSNATLEPRCGSSFALQRCNSSSQRECGDPTVIPQLSQTPK